MDENSTLLDHGSREEIEKAHHAHVQLLNELSDAIVTWTVSKEHIDKIINSFKGHFEYEEELMKSHNVPTLIAHTKEHKNIIYKFEEALNLIGNGDVEEKNLRVEYLRDLFLNHIDLWDSQYVPYLTKSPSKN